MWLLLAILSGLVLTLVLHESGHAFMAKIRGAKIISFKPYPHLDSQKNLWFGYVKYQILPGFKPSKWIHGAPMITSLLLGGLSVLGAMTMSPYFWAWASFAAVDHLWFWRGYFSLLTRRPKELDGYKFRNFGK